jgi:hypothetical protein
MMSRALVPRAFLRNRVDVTTWTLTIFGANDRIVGSLGLVLRFKLFPFGFRASFTLLPWLIQGELESGPEGSKLAPVRGLRAAAVRGL